MSISKIISIWLVVLIIVGGGLFVYENYFARTEDSDSTEKACVSDAGCKTGFSCWYQTPRGPFTGVRGSKENPGKCFSDEVIRQIY